MIVNLDSNILQAKISTFTLSRRRKRKSGKAVETMIT